MAVKAVKKLPCVFCGNLVADGEPKKGHKKSCELVKQWAEEARLAEENCASCARLRQEIVLLRDAVETLASRIIALQGKRPDALRAGRPLWTYCIPEKVRDLWRGR
jgi:hypothetical protein